MTKGKLETVNRAELIALIEAQQQIIVELRAEIKRLKEREAVSEGERSGGKGETESSTPVWVKPKRRKRAVGDKPRKKRKGGFARKRSKPTRRVYHAIDQCRRCGCRLGGGSEKRSREVLHIPIAPVEVIEHVFIERRCPICNKREVPGAEVLAGEVLGQHRVSVQTMAVIATLREVGRLPIETIQWVLETFYQLHLSVGEIVEILHTVAEKAKGRVEELLRKLRASPVVHGDETTWREDGQNGYVWSFSTPQESYFEYRQSRSGQAVLDIVGEDFEGVLVSDFYGGYNRMLGIHQRCWAHLLRAVHELKEKHPDNEELLAWGKAVNALYKEAVRYREKHREAKQKIRTAAQHRYERELMAFCRPFLGKDVPQRVLCQRVERFLSELFAFVADPRVPPDNNAAERAVRPLTVCRKISGGTRSPRGSQTKSTLASIFYTWRLRGIQPFLACRQLLTSPQV